MSAHSWERTEAIEAAGAAILDDVFAVDYIIVPATREHQRQKIDRVFIHRQDARQILRVDYKVDQRAGDTQNLALEEVSVMRDGKVMARGWIHDTIAHWIIFYVPVNEMAYVSDAEVLSGRWPEIQASFGTLESLSECRDPRKKQYKSRFYPVPIVWLRARGFFREERTSRGVQMRLKLVK